jgi:hypothetical protein
MEFYNNLFRRVPRHIRQLTLILVGAVALLAVVAIFLLVKIQGYRKPVLSAEERLQQLVAEIGQVAVLPKDEAPTVATVVDPSKLRDQAFFANVEAGDQVLIYPHSKRAVLWRPSLHKIVEISTVNNILESPTSSQ